MDTVTIITTLINSPLGHLGAAALLTLALVLGSYAIKTQPKAKDFAQDIADLAEEVEPWVLEAENAFMRGDAKYSSVLNKAEAWLLEQGITGQRGRLLKKYLPAFIEAAVKRVDPKLGPKKAA